MPCLFGVTENNLIFREFSIFIRLILGQAVPQKFVIPCPWLENWTLSSSTEEEAVVLIRVKNYSFPGEIAIDSRKNSN